MNKAIIIVVPHPGATFPYSEFKGFNADPSAVTFPVFSGEDTFDLEIVAICFLFFKLNLSLFLLSLLVNG